MEARVPDPGRSLYEALRALERRGVTARQKAGLPSSRREAAALAGKAPYCAELDSRRLSSWLPDDPASAQVPRAADAEKVWALVRVWAGWAGEPQPQQRYWMDLIEAAQPARVRATAENDGAGWLINDLADPFVLEVHRPIELSGAVGLPVLPPYVPRDHDRQLADVVARAEGGESAIGVLVGGSSTGKTRACWQVIQALPAGWRLWHPIFPDRAEAFLAGLKGVKPRTVVWLNEAQFYLLTGDPQIGEQVAAGLRDLLRDLDRPPILVLGTIWPRYWQPLVAPVARDGQDPHAQARELLTGAGIEVPGTFTGSALRALRAAARTDPRLAAAEKAEDGQVTQFLAGVPVLLERYRTAPPLARAVIQAAMDARALGHGPALPQTLLEAAAPGYLTRDQWEEDAGEDWLEQALTYAAARCRGTRGPLTRIRSRPGRPAPVQPHYRLADYLEQTGDAGRESTPPALLWDALLAEAMRQDLPRIAAQAQARSLFRYAFKLFLAATDASALTRAAAMLQEAGRTGEAIALYQRAAEASDPAAPCRAAEMLQEAGRTEEAIVWYRRASEAGDLNAVGRMAKMLREAGRAEEAISWTRARAEAGNPSALVQAAEMLREAGREEEAITWLRARAEAGDTFAMGQAAGILQEAGRAEEAISWLRARAEAGDPSASWWAAQMLRETGRVEEAISFYQRAAEAGAPNAVWPATEMLREARRSEEAIRWLESLAEARNPSALWRLVEMLHEGGRAEEAITSLQPRAQAGDPNAVWRVAEMLRKAGRAEEAISFYRRAAEAGDRLAVDRAAALLQEAGRAEEAISWLQSQAEAGDPNAAWRAAEMLQKAGRTEDAIRWLRTRAEAGDTFAVRQAAGMLRKAGRAEEASSLYRRAAEAGDPDALAQVAEMLRGAGRIEEAISWLQSLAETGNSFALGQAARMLCETGRSQEAITFYQRAAEAGDPDALAQAAEMLQQAGRAEEAARLHRYGIEPGGRIADPWEANAPI